MDFVCVGLLVCGQHSFACAGLQEAAGKESAAKPTAEPRQRPLDSKEAAAGEKSAVKVFKTRHKSLDFNMGAAAGKESVFTPKTKPMQRPLDSKEATAGEEPVFKARPKPKHLPPGCKVMWTRSNSKWPKGVIGTVYGPHGSNPKRVIIHVSGNRFGILKEELERVQSVAEQKATVQLKQKKLSHPWLKLKGAVKMYTDKFSSALKARGDDDIVSLLRYTLIPNASKTTEKVAYLKDVADYYRYVAEHTEHLNERQTAADKAKNFYHEAIETGKAGCGVNSEKLSDAHPMLLGTKLNLVVLMHDILNQPESAYKAVKKDFDLAVGKLECLPDEEYQDARKIMEVMLANSKDWEQEQSKC